MDPRPPLPLLAPETLDRINVADHLCPVFQPIYDREMRVVSYEALMRVVAANGAVALHVGTHSHGQSHETAFAQMINQWLGVVPDQVTLFQGDTDKVLFGRGTFSQRSMSTGGYPRA